MKTIEITELCKRIGRSEDEWSALIGCKINNASGSFKIVSLNVDANERISSICFKSKNHTESISINNLQTQFRSINLSETIFNKIYFPEKYRLARDAEIKRKKEKAEEAEKRRAHEQEQRNYLHILNAEFQNDYLNAEKFYATNLRQQVTQKDFEHARAAFVKTWFNQYPDAQIDEEQAIAIADTTFHTLVTARAGSGKTATIVNKIIFLNQHCKIAPEEFLVLVFNTNAAQEIRDRLKAKTGLDFLNVMTFHSLAYSVVKPQEALLYDNPKADDFNLSGRIQMIIDDHIRNPVWSSKFKSLMMAYFREDWEAITEKGFNLTPAETLQFRRSLPKIGLDGWHYKSRGEKLIADFFFEHDIGFEYERNFWWQNVNYKPDFTVRDQKGGIIIEYFGIKNDPNYDAQIVAKRQFWNRQRDWKLVEIYPDMISGSASFREILSTELISRHMKVKKLSEEELWEKIEDRSIDQFSKLCATFINRARQESHTAVTISKLIEKHNLTFDHERTFLEIAESIYGHYLDFLVNAGEEDFSGLLERAATQIDAGRTVFHKKNYSADLKSIKICMIDEYQDFSNLFFKCLTAFRSQNKTAKLFCVGDNWQAINRFAGSNTTYFTEFSKYFGNAKQLKISTNYRSKKHIVGAGNSIMQNNGMPAISSSNELGSIKIVDLDKFEISIPERHKFDHQTFVPAIIRICAQLLKNKKTVTLLSRTNHVRWPIGGINAKLDEFLIELRKFFPESVRENIDASSAHSYKGKQADAIILIDFKQSYYPFIHPQNNFSRIFGDNLGTVLSDELNLLYVALTRAKSDLFLITETGQYPICLSDFRSAISPMRWADYPAAIHLDRDPDTHIIAVTGNTIPIKDILKRLSYRWNPATKTWSRQLRIKEIEIMDHLEASNWLTHLTDGSISILDSNGTRKYLLSVKHGKVIRKYDI